VLPVSALELSMSLEIALGIVMLLLTRIIPQMQKEIEQAAKQKSLDAAKAAKADTGKGKKK